MSPDNRHGVGPEEVETDAKKVGGVVLGPDTLSEELNEIIEELRTKRIESGDNRTTEEVAEGNAGRFWS